MRILITGGAGFIGSHITKLLLDEGHEVVVYDNSSSNISRLSVTLSNPSVTLSGAKGIKSLYSSPAAQNDKTLTLIEGDLNDQESLKKALDKVDAVIHMASLIEVSQSVKYPLKFAENNIIGSINLFEAMKEAGVNKIIFSSSGS